MPNRVPSHRPQRPGNHPPTERHQSYNRSRRDPFLLKLYSTYAWQKFRAFIREVRVLCESCKERGLTVLGEHVHHKIDPRDMPDLAFDPDNVLLWCKSCHSAFHASKGRR